MDNFKETTLEGHINLCELRYRNLEDKINAFDKRLIDVENKISTLKNEMVQGFSDIKLLIEKQNNARTIQVIATFGTIAVALISLIGYLLTRH